ncbi:MAG: hypothetical protein JW718_08635 [Desulfovibrionaceae bacterium]|nr:hypothetical protein [Desulfovibrionaceae bacterium]
MALDLGLAREVLRLRLGMMIINEMYKAKAFKVPIHLAMGHEALAVAVSALMDPDDVLVCSHRNIHYNLARNPSLKSEIDEFLLKDQGLAQGRLGSMNLANPARGLVYSSSILGNNLCVAAGLALAKKVKAEPGAVLVVTGDGAMEEGAFYESLEFMASYDLPCLVLVENNGWSLATRIHERRCHIHLDLFARAFDAPYLLLEGNDPYAYLAELRSARDLALAGPGPVLVEARMLTLGDWRLKTEDFPEGKFINYHAGPAPTVELSDWPLIRADESDPLHVLCGLLGEQMVRDMALALRRDLEGEAA